MVEGCSNMQGWVSRKEQSPILDRVCRAQRMWVQADRMMIGLFRFRSGWQSLSSYSGASAHRHLSTIEMILNLCSLYGMNAEWGFVLLYVALQPLHFLFWCNAVCKYTHYFMSIYGAVHGVHHTIFLTVFDPLHLSQTVTNLRPPLKVHHRSWTPLKHWLEITSCKFSI